MAAPRTFAALAVALFALVSAKPASALSLYPACTGDCFGVDITVNVSLTNLQIIMDFENYVGTSGFPPGHPNLEAFALKIFTNDAVTYSFVSGDLDGNSYTNYTTQDPGGLANGGCKDVGTGWDCFAYDDPVPGPLDIIADGKRTLTLNYTISNAGALRGAGDSSIQVLFGPDNGWLISEALIPEPTGAALFLVGGVVLHSSVRRRRAVRA
jgi:hypothetical protein